MGRQELEILRGNEHVSFTYATPIITLILNSLRRVSIKDKQDRMPGGGEQQQGPGGVESLLLPDPGPKVSRLLPYRSPLQDQADLRSQGSYWEPLSYVICACWLE